MTGTRALGGRIVLIVEDDYYIASDTAAAVREAGATVLGPCQNEETVRDLIARQPPTHALVDLNLGGQGPRFAIAYLLREQGVPFVFLTGYDPGVIPADLAGVECLQKPAPFPMIVEALARL